MNRLVALCCSAVVLALSASCAQIEEGDVAEPVVVEGAPQPLGSTPPTCTATSCSCNAPQSLTQPLISNAFPLGGPLPPMLPWPGTCSSCILVMTNAGVPWEEAWALCTVLKSAGCDWLFEACLGAPSDTFRKSCMTGYLALCSGQ